MKKKPQKGNPHELTVKQHCFPRRSIERFVNDDRIVHVWLIEQGKPIPARPEDQLFCAHWVWDQRAETGFMREVEDAYQELADDIEEGRIVRRLRVAENRVVTEMYSLWRVRSKWRRIPLPDEPLKDVIELEYECSKDERERLEKAGVSVIGPGPKLDGRHIASGVMQLHFFRLRERLKGLRWAILSTRDAEFLVPDTAETSYLPVTPKLCLVPGEGYQIADASTVATFNARSVSESCDHFFAKSSVDASGIVKADRDSPQVLG